jgi:hypothetical protein
MADLDIRLATYQTDLRLLCTGSRDWRDWISIRRVLGFYVGSVQGTVTVIHGAQVSEDEKTHEKWGADYIVDQVARELGAVVDPHPAKWRMFGKRAGRLRNQEMVDLHFIRPIDLCLAWPLGKSPGTRDCMARAELAHIPVENHGDKDWR